MTPYDFFLIAIATWRVSNFLVNEKGPLGIFEKLRSLAGIEQWQVDDKPEVYKAVPDTFLAQVLDCVWCCSVWIGIGWVSLYLYSPAVAVWVSYPMAISAVAIFIHWILNR